MLRRVYIDNFRSFVNFQCEFGPKQLILGPNGGGKSNLFTVLAYLRDFCAYGVPGENLFAGATRTRWQTVSEQTFELDVAGNDGDYKLRLILDTWGSPTPRPRVVREEVLFC